jgi:hypothetical protein
LEYLPRGEECYSFNVPDLFLAGFRFRFRFALVLGPGGLSPGVLRG